MGQEQPPSAVTGQPGDQAGPLRLCSCGVWFRPVKWNQRFCHSKEADKAYNAAHPVVRQRTMDFLPTARELGAAVGRRETRAQAILARLRRGPASSQELLRVGGLRYGARLLELRRAGHRITTEDHLDSATYTLEGE